MGCDKGLWETTFLMRVSSQSFFFSMPEGYGNNKKWKGGNRQMKDKIQPKTNTKGNDKDKNKDFLLLYRTTSYVASLKKAGG